MTQTNATNGTTEQRRPSGLVRTLDEIYELQPGEYLECPHCKSEWDRAVTHQLDVSDREHVRCTCGKSGFVLRGSRRNQSVAARRPMLSGTFYPSAMELRVYGKQLELDFADRAVIEAIDQFPDGWDMTRESIAETAGCSVARVKRTLSKLQNHRDGDRARPLIDRKVRLFRGRPSGTIYDLTRLWVALAEVATAEADARKTSDSDSSAARMEPWSAARIEPSPLDVQSLRVLSLTRERDDSLALNTRVSSPADSQTLKSSFEGERASPTQSNDSFDREHDQVELAA